MIVFAFILLIGGLGAVVVWALKSNKKITQVRTKMYEDLASQYNLKHTQSSYLMATLNKAEGVLNGKPIKIYDEVYGGRKNKQIGVNVQIDNLTVQLEFKIQKGNFFSKAGKLLGATNIELGNQVLDKELKFKSNDPEHFKMLFQGNLDQGLQQCFNVIQGSIDLQKNSLHYWHYKTIRKEIQAKNFMKLFSFLIEIVEHTDHSKSVTAV